MDLSWIIGGGHRSGRSFIDSKEHGKTMLAPTFIGEGGKTMLTFCLLGEHGPPNPHPLDLLLLGEKANFTSVTVHTAQIIWLRVDLKEFLKRDTNTQASHFSMFRSASFHLVPPNIQRYSVLVFSHR